MELAAQQRLPISFHSDAGNTGNPQAFVHLMDLVLNLYGNANDIVWLHLGGCSKELKFSETSKLDRHFEMLGKRLEKYPKLKVDLAWDVLFDNVYSLDEGLAKTVSLLNKYPDRFIAGTDFVAALSKNQTQYAYELQKTGAPFQFASHEAFRKVALGQNWFELLNLPMRAPTICPDELLWKQMLSNENQTKKYDAK